MRTTVFAVWLEVESCQYSRRECGFETVVCCAGSSPLSEVGHGYKAGMQPAVCDAPREQSRRQVETVVLEAAVGLCAPSEPVSFSSGLDVISEHAVICRFSADLSAPVQDTFCVDRPSAQSVMNECRAVSGGFGGAVSFGGSCGEGTLQTPHAHLATSQPDGYLETSWCHAPRTSAERNAISHEAAETFLRSQTARTDEKFPGIMHVSHQLLHGHKNVFLCAQCGY